MAKILSELQVKQFLSRKHSHQLKKDSVVLCHGVFDVVHPGHIDHLQEAKSYGDILFVSITSDRFVNKGPNRPYFDQFRRASFLACLEMVDYVYIADSESAIHAIDLIKPDFYAKGSDYKVASSDITGKIELEKKTVEKYGGTLIFTEGFTSSSTSIINKYLTPQNSEISIWRNKFKKKSNLTEVIYWIDELKRVEVNILGETIIDAYTSCRPLSKSSKDPLLAFHSIDTKKFMGGVLAIADSCSKWSKKTSVVSVCGEDLDQHLSEINKSYDFDFQYFPLKNVPTILKHRFVDISSGNRVFEYYDFQPEDISMQTQKRILNSLGRLLNNGSLFLIADYGHGFFGENLIQTLCRSESFLAVNAQANAGNRGFNTFSKYSRIDFLSLNGGELELEIRKKDIDYKSVIPKIIKEKKCRNAIVTLGGGGLLTFDTFGNFASTPAFATKVVDKVGAGDSVLAISSMLSFLGAPIEVIGLLASVVAAFEVSQLGHAESLDIISMKRHVSGLLN